MTIHPLQLIPISLILSLSIALGFVSTTLIHTYNTERMVQNREHIREAILSYKREFSIAEIDLEQNILVFDIIKNAPNQSSEIAGAQRVEVSVDEFTIVYKQTATAENGVIRKLENIEELDLASLSVGDSGIARINVDPSGTLRVSIIQIGIPFDVN